MAQLLFPGKVYEEAIVRGNFNIIKEDYTKESSAYLTNPLTPANDTAFHMAVYSKTKEPLQHLLVIAENDRAYSKKNSYGITALHVAAKVGNYEAVKLLVEKDRNLLEIQDNLGETPLFKAAANGRMRVVKYLASQREQMDDSAYRKLKQIHRCRKNGDPIFHAAILGAHYGTALMLEKLDESLALEEDKSGISSLQLLANFPSAFRSGYPMGLWTRILYSCLPVFNYTYEVDRDNVAKPSVDIETGDIHIQGEDEQGAGTVLTVSKTINRYTVFWRFLSEVLPKMGTLWKEKRKHEFALKLAKILIEKDYSSEQSLSYDPTSFIREVPEIAKGPEPETQEHDEIKESYSRTVISENPLFTATRNGIEEIVKEILRAFPYAVELYSLEKKNILHIAVLHRQKTIFDMVKKRKIPLSRLVDGIDKNGYTILHCAADKKHYTGTSRPGPAYQLQDELKWFHRVAKLVSPHLAIHPDIKNNKTAKQLFNDQHRDNLKDAQEWIKQTSQSCSTVAVLVATVVFAAAYTVPGGLNDSGLPHFLNSPSFFFFTVMDIVSLACSLTAVVMFLSILSSPFEMEDFLFSLPRKLTAGFTLLFLSVATTTLAFASTVLLIIRLASRQLTTTLVYTAAFLPVGVLALMQFPLYVAFVESLGSISKFIRKTYLFKLVRRLFSN